MSTQTHWRTGTTESRTPSSTVSPLRPADAASANQATNDSAGSLAPASFVDAMAYLADGQSRYGALLWEIDNRLRSKAFRPHDGRRALGSAGSARPSDSLCNDIESEFATALAAVQSIVTEAGALQLELITYASLAVFDSRQRLSFALESGARQYTDRVHEKSLLAQREINRCTDETEQLMAVIERGVEALAALARSTGSRVMSALSLH